jgi:hypothetical protein
VVGEEGVGHVPNEVKNLYHGNKHCVSDYNERFSLHILV